MSLLIFLCYYTRITGRKLYDGIMYFLMVEESGITFPGK